MTNKYFLCIFPLKNKEKGGGVERRLLRTINYINKNNYDKISVITNINTKGFIKELLNDDIYFEIIEFKEANKLTIFIELINIISSLKNSIIHIINPTINNFILLLIIKLFRNKLYISIVDYTHTMKKNTHLQKSINYLSFYLADKIDWLYSYYNTFWKSDVVKKKSSNTLCSFTNYNIFDNNNVDKANIILFSGRFVDLKQPILLLEALNELKDILIKHSFKVIFLGDGDLKNKMETYIKRTNLNELVELNFSAEPSRFYKISKIFISIQKYENYPSQSILEAIASKNLIIATDVGDTRKLLNDKNSILIENDKNSLVKGIHNAILNYNDYKLELNLLREKTIDFHNIKNSANYYREFYK